MTDAKITAAQRLRWLCCELMAGNEFSQDQLERWFYDADMEVHAQNRISDAEANGKPVKLDPSELYMILYS